MNRSHPMRPRIATAPGLLLASVLFVVPANVVALDAPSPLSQYAHTSWTVRDGYPLGAVFSMAQTHDGYLWLASEFGLSRFDGVRFTRWQPPAGQELPDKPYSLWVSRDGTLWIGTFAGLASWNGVELTLYPDVNTGFVTSLLEDRDGTMWAGILANPGQLCAVRDGRVKCHEPDGGFGQFVWSLLEDDSGTLWAGAESGLWRWKPGTPKRFAAPGRIGDLITSVDGELLVSIRGAGLKRMVGDQLESYPLRNTSNPAGYLAEHLIKSNKMLRDREGSVWIGTDGLGLMHVKDGTANFMTKATGLSGNIACALFEDREGNVWFSSEKGLDRFRKLTVATLSGQRGEASDITKSILAAADGSVWVATFDGVTRWKDGRPAQVGTGSKLLDGGAQSLFQDHRGRVWASTYGGLAYFRGDELVPVDGQPGNEVASMAGDEAGTLWLSGPSGLARLQNGRHVETVPWPALGRRQQAKVLVADQGGVWMSFWQDGGVLYFKDGQVRSRYTTALGLGKGHVSGLRLDRDGAVWAATEEGGLSRIKDGRISTLTTANGLPCNTIHWSIEDDHRSLWVYAACGLVRIARDEVDAWIGNHAHRVVAKRWGAADGVPLRSVSPAYFNPPVAKATDGKLWIVSGEAVQVIDPDNLPFNKIPPTVYIEQVIADRKPYSVANGLHLPPLVRDVTIEFTALSLIDPHTVQFRYRLEGHDDEWQEAGDRRQAFYTNLRPGNFRFHVKASNNSGVWNEEGAQLQFSIAPAFYQTLWFRIACAALIAGLVWSGFLLRTRRLRHEEKRLRDVIGGIPTMAFSVNPDGSPDLVNQRWLEYSGLSARTADTGSWETVIHPADVKAHLEKWRSALASGEPFENEARHRNSATGEYRWFLVQAVPLRDKQGRIMKWYGTLTDIEERKRAEEERERLRGLEAQLAHTNRLSMLGELTASLAHEINQPIAAAITSAGACLRWLDRDQPDLQRASEAIARIKEDGKRAADIIAGLKAFYRKDGPPKHALLDVNEVVGEILVLLRREADRQSVSMKTELASALPSVRADRVQIQQVLMNLMLNAIEAMGSAGGELIIRTRSTHAELAVSVSDTGVGLPANDREQIFSAFYTTKAAGTGMGLAISRTIVEAHGGRIWAEANATQGATFHFTLPLAAAA
jgi:PAS domain S-box-containing protein